MTESGLEVKNIIEAKVDEEIEVGISGDKVIKPPSMNNIKSWDDIQQEIRKMSGQAPSLLRNLYTDRSSINLSDSKEFLDEFDQLVLERELAK